MSELVIVLEGSPEGSSVFASKSSRWLPCIQYWREC